MAAVLAAASYSRGGFSPCLASIARRVLVPGGSTFHLEPGTMLAAARYSREDISVLALLVVQGLLWFQVEVCSTSNLEQYLCPCHPLVSFACDLITAILNFCSLLQNFERMC